MTDRRTQDIGARLENWARVYRPCRTIGISPTAAFCEELKRNALGESATGERRKVDEADADLIERAMRNITPRDRRILKLCYIDQAQPLEVCRKLSLAHRPATIFVEAFRKAQGAVESLINNGSASANETRL